MKQRNIFNRMGFAAQLGKLGDVIENLENSISDKVDAEQGKGLSTNDFTDEYKVKLDELMSGGA